MNRISQPNAHQKYGCWCIFFIHIALYNLIQSNYCCAVDTITQSQKILAGETLTSSGQIFQLGFFSPDNSGKQYVGIWHKNLPVRKVVWVANRENPLAVTDSLASLMIGSDGNLMLVDGKQNIVWSTNVSVPTNDSVAVLLDKGDLVLKDASGEFFWESFNHPSDTILPGMMIGMNTKTGERRFLTSWQMEDDPSAGKFVAGISSQTPFQTFVWNKSTPYWRSGQWNGMKFVGIPEMGAIYLTGFSLVQDNEEGTEYFNFNTFNSSNIRIAVLTSNGSLQIIGWDLGGTEWNVHWEAPQSPCDIYGTCGPFGVCNKNHSPICRCLKGFVPKSNEEWNKGKWTDGCVRRTKLLCDKKITNTSSKSDGFRKLSGVKLPDFSDHLHLQDEGDCELWCLNNCSCVAYAYVTGIECMVWTGDLLDIQDFLFTGENFFLRLANSELGKRKHEVKVIIGFTLVSSIIFLGAILYGLCRLKANQRGKKDKIIKCFDSADAINTSKHTHEEYFSRNEVKQDQLELPMFDFDKIVVATDNFSIKNKIGEGGFGPVYKGKLQDELEIAVKRLSSRSGQGIDEFKNEIILISQLQHKNLVRLLGCCIEGEELLIIYEYMSNKSLDTFLFDLTKRAQLNWATRFKIIHGIARGLLYLHQDSCLKIIHRDLKVSNILLGDDLNPKISDFGLARIFQATQELANTHRVVGTFGYMSPEYAMGGIFSEKSDVFSFGVILLEIVSSRKNTDFYDPEGHLNLLGYAWQMWNEQRGLDFMDKTLATSFSPVEVMRCLHVGLLCVQDHPADRPTMSDTVFMLGNEADLPQPKQPTFVFHRSSSHFQPDSINVVTESLLEGR